MSVNGLVWIKIKSISSRLKCVLVWCSVLLVALRSLRIQSATNSVSGVAAVGAKASTSRARGKSSTEYRCTYHLNQKGVRSRTAPFSGQIALLFHSSGIEMIDPINTQWRYTTQLDRWVAPRSLPITNSECMCKDSVRTDITRRHNYNRTLVLHTCSMQMFPIRLTVCVAEFLPCLLQVSLCFTSFQFLQSNCIILSSIFSMNYEALLILTKTETICC